MVIQDHGFAPRFGAAFAVFLQMPGGIEALVDFQSL